MASDRMKMRGHNVPLKTAEDTIAEADHEGLQRSGSNQDEMFLARAGKKQQMNRNFGFIATVAFSSTLLATWEGLSSSFQAGLNNGGPVSLVYGLILSFSGTMAMSASLAEMASILPIAGAQYHWTAQFAPKGWSAFASWMQGWITVFAWQATVSSVTFLVATQVQGLVILNYDSYTPERWHGTMLMWALMALAFLVNTIGIKLLPHLESLAGVCHVLFFFALLIPLVYLSPQSTPEFVFTKFLNEGGWHSNGISWCVGLLTVTFPFIGYDGVVHMSEEVSNAPTTVPRSMVLTVFINGILAFGWLIALLFSVGDYKEALDSPTGYPIIEVFHSATKSRAGATAMMSAILVVTFATDFAILASTSRLTWAFARDNGLPFSKFFAHINPTFKIPIRAICLVTIVTILLSLINIASTTAFNAVLSLATLALNISYLIPVILFFLKRVRNEPIPFGPFTLGRWGFYINLFAIVYTVFICIFLPFPPDQPVTKVNMNYASPVFGAVLLFALGDWFVRGKRLFVGPLREVAEDDIR
ncbi:MAG: hypothetical protein M1835_006012 [Candelina submexicana]|nr:MAG: hypothetical protein M1835_006012 [Candelina submexicana]